MIKKPKYAFAISIASLLGALGATGDANAAAYRVLECTLGHGFIGAPDARAFAAGMGPNVTDRCALGGDLNGLYSNGQPHPTATQNGRNGWDLHPPAGTRLVGAAVAARGAHAEGVYPELWASLPGSAGDGAIPSQTTVQWGGGDTLTGAWTTYAWDGSSSPAQKISFQVRCVLALGCAASTTPLLAVRDIRITLDDVAGPSIGPLAGPLLDAGTHGSARGILDLSIGGSDLGSGLYAAWVDAAGERLADGGYGCDVTADGQAKRFSPCPGSARRNLAVDTADPSLHTGLNRIIACVADFAGQRACTDADVRVDNACPDAGVPVASLESVRFKGGGTPRRNQKATVKARFGPKVKIVGRAVDANGSPVAGATVCLAHHIHGDAYAGEEANWTRTGRSGRFRFPLQKGPSKDYRIAAWQGASAHEYYRTLLVRAKPVLKIEGRPRSGRALRLQVALNQPGATGRRVKIRARADAGWVGVPRCTGEANGKGRFGCRFKIPKGSRGAKLSFQAVVPAAQGYPYLRGHSKTRSVAVR